MRFLADESCDAGVVESLRNVGHDIVDVRELSPGADDPFVVGLALKQQRILLTEDKDFGQLVFAGGHENPGVILIRVPVTARTWLLANIAAIIRIHADSMPQRFLVIEPGKVRLT